MKVADAHILPIGNLNEDAFPTNKTPVGCKVEFETLDDGFVVIFYRHGTQKLSGTAQKEEKTA